MLALMMSIVDLGAWGVERGEAPPVTGGSIALTFGLNRLNRSFTLVQRIL